MSQLSQRQHGHSNSFETRYRWTIATVFLSMIAIASSLPTGGLPNNCPVISVGYCLYSWLALCGFELWWAQMVLVQEFVEFSPVALCNTGSLGNVAIGHL